jgi:cytochrome c oxidase cbb3-type subunit 3
MKKKLTYIIATMLVPALPVVSVALDAAAPVTGGGIPKMFFDPAFYILSGLFLVMFITIWVLTRVMMKLIRQQLPEVIVAEEKTVVAQAETLSLWARFDRKFLTKAVPVEKERDILFDHGYDGIHELDNDLPPWWKYGFYLTIVWAFGYLVYFHVTDSGALSLQEYKNEIAEADAALKARMLKNADMVNSETVIALTDADAISAGQGIYIQNCVACHGQKGEGSVGPNLTDEYWIHGGGIKNVFKTVQNGVPAKGMISWKSQLSPKQIQQVSSFILTFQGTKPDNGKAPQGDIWKEEVAAVDSTVVTVKDSAAAAPVSLK